MKRKYLIIGGVVAVLAAVGGWQATHRGPKPTIVETALVDASPQWLTELTTRF